MDKSRNGKLNAVYQDPMGLAKSTLSQRHIQHIVKAYSNESQHVIVLELEAFSVAAMNDPAEQTRDIQKYCF